MTHKSLIAATSIQLLCAILASRVALLILSVVSIFVIYSVKMVHNSKLRISPKRLLAISCSVVVIICLIMVFRDYIMLIWNLTINKVLQESGSNSTAVRAMESKALINGWLQSPLIGHGAGSFTSEYIRDPDMPWAYELSYHSLLYQTGIIGVGVTMYFYYFILAGLIQHRSTYNLNDIVGFGFFSGLLSFLIANSVDPYLGKFGFMWVLFIPLSYTVNKKRLGGYLMN